MNEMLGVVEIILVRISFDGSVVIYQIAEIKCSPIFFAILYFLSSQLLTGTAESVSIQQETNVAFAMKRANLVDAHLVTPTVAGHALVNVCLLVSNLIRYMDGNE